MQFNSFINQHLLLYNIDSSILGNIINDNLYTSGQEWIGFALQ